MLFYPMKRASSIGSDEFKNVAKMKDVRRRKSLDMFAMNKEIRNSAEMSMMGAFDSIVFEGIVIAFFCHFISFASLFHP